MHRILVQAPSLENNGICRCCYQKAKLACATLLNYPVNPLERLVPNLSQIYPYIFYSEKQIYAAVIDPGP